MELRPGYKQTEVGVIPEDWDVRPLLTTVRIANGQVSPLTEPYKSMVLVAPDHIEGSTGRLLVMKTAAEQRAISGKYVFDGGDVVYSKIRPYLRKAILADFRGLCSADMYPLRTMADVSSGFILAVLLGHHFSTYAESVSVRSGMPKINRSELAGYLLALPRLPEQRAIAAALNDVDALLKGLTKLIAKKRDVKQAAMQQLLTGETRLPGFHAEWENKTLGEIGECVIGLTYSPENVVQHGLLVLRSSNIQNGRVVYEDNVYVNLKVAEDLYVRQGDILICVRNGSRTLIGKCVLINEGAVGMTFGAFMSVYRTAHWRFIFHAFQGDHIQRQIRDNIGATINQITNKDLKAFRLKLPPEDEQIAIAAVLSDMDAELAAIEARRDKTRALKQAMMQELLTGRTRFVVPTFTEGRKDTERRAGRRANIHFKRSVLAAEIIDRLHDEPTFGHVKFEKTIFLVEHLCDVDTGSTYHRDAAGPYDNRAMRSIDSQLRKQKWFDAQKLKGRYRYQPMMNRGKHRDYFERYFSGIRTSFDTVIDTFRHLTTERCEIVATLFAAWNDLLQQNRPISDDEIVNEVVNNWHESKKRISEDRWRKALSWMRDKNFVPHTASGDLS